MEQVEEQRPGAPLLPQPLRGTIFGALLAFLPAIAFAQLTTYTYTGDLYTSLQPPYAAGQRLTGSFTLSAPLPPFRPLGDLGPALVAMTFHDGVEGRGLANSFVCRFEVATDGAGAITQWDIRLRRSPYGPLDPQHSIESTGALGIVQGSDFVGIGPGGAGPCDPVALAPAASASTQGIWVSDHPLPSDPTVYSYDGAPYTTAAPPYLVGDALSGTVTFANPLPAFLPLTDVTPALAGFAFHDGVEGRSLADSFPCRFEVATDGGGNIRSWRIALRRSPYATGDPQHSIESSGQVGVIGGNDLAGSGPAGPGPCDPISLAPAAASSIQGTWTSDHPLPPDPATYTYVGDPFVFADPPYALAGSLHGSLTLAGPLPPHLPLTDVAPAIAAFSFFDGVQTRTLADSYLCRFEVATDGAGNIARWQIVLRRFPSDPGDPHPGIESGGQPGVVQGNDLVGTGVAPADPCGPMLFSPAAGTASQGTWTGDHVSPSQPTLYRYVGDPYVAATPPYAGGGNLAGSVLLANPLPPFLPMTDITPSITALAFDDGVQLRQLTDSFLCAFEAATDGAGAITRWQVSLRAFPYGPASPQHSIDSSGLPDPFGGNDLVGSGPAAADPCGPVTLDPFASTGSRGTWTQEGGGSVVEIPALDAKGLAALALALAAAASVALRRRRTRG
jgi:hypothetical protein